MPDDRACRMRTLNDQFRRTLSGGRVHVTCGVNALGPDTVGTILAQVRGFDNFDPCNDPHGEHDFGSFQHADQRVLWKIDYYDRTLTACSPDPADPKVTTRVLTVLLASEY